MKIVQLRAENFKRLQAVEITPEGNIVQIRGKNGSGKSSVLDAIYVALVGRSVAPPKPVRTGEEKCLIRLDLGDLAVTRTFTVKEGSQYTDTLKVENDAGLRYSKPQEVLDALLGEIGFDPFEFVQMKAKDQAEALLKMVPLSVDLDELQEQDESDFANRRDINRDVAGLKAQVDAIPKEDVPADLPDRQALVDQLGNAAQTNSEIERARLERERDRERADEETARAQNLRREIERLTSEAVLAEQNATRASEKISKAEPLPEPVDTEAIRTQLREAETLIAAAERQERRRIMSEKLAESQGESQRLTEAMEARAKARNDALASAEMPIEGLAFAIDERGHAMVQFGGVPFEQASSAEQLRASTAIAMAANPSLRVLRVKDGSLLDDDSMKLLAEMAKAEDFQLWVEVVGTGGVGIVMEDGAIAELKPSGKVEGGKEKGKPAAKAEKKADGALL